MESRSLKSYDDIVKYLEYLNDEYEKDFKEVTNINIGIFDLVGKKDKEERKKELKRQLINYVISYDQCDKFLKDSTTFRRQDFVRFLAEYFSMIYGKKYVYKCDISDKKQVYSVISYDLIISEDDMKSFCGDGEMIKSLDIDTLFDCCNDCCLLLDNSLKFTLLDGVNLSADFEDFPELIVAARNLVDLKLAKPEMSDQRRLASVLNRRFMDIEAETPNVESVQRLGKSYPNN